MNLFKEKMRIMRSMKEFLDAKGFHEVITPTLRREAGSLIPRLKVRSQSGEDYGALRDSHELQLRWLLTEYDSAYEIGSCFREEGESPNNLREFLLMELFTVKYNCNELMEVVKEFLLRYKPDVSFEKISVAEHIKAELGIDLSRDPQELLFKKLKNMYPNGAGKNDYEYEYVLQYIEDKVEPLSRGKIAFFYDYPECTCSYAKIKSGNIISRFELFADELELANGFDDECSSELFRSRNMELPIFEGEEGAIADALKSGLLPRASAGVGIGIERLCMFIYGSKRIKDFSFPSDTF